MSDEPPPSKPEPIRPTAEWLAEQRARNAAYEEQRRAYTQAWDRRLAGLADEPEEAPEHAREVQPGKTRRSRARGVIHDPRQGKLEF